MIHPHILHNDSIQDAATLCLAPGQVGLLSGWGVFSTLKVTSGVPFAFERHWARLERDAAALHVPLPADGARVHGKLLELIEANRARQSTLRLAVVRNTGGLWQGPSGGRASDLLALTADTKDWGQGVKLCYQAEARHAGCAFAGTKSLSWAANLTWLETAQSRGFDEVLLLNERGEIAECTSANVFAAWGHEVRTPPLEAGCLPGITREILLHEIHVPGIQVVEKTLRPADLASADEVFITSTTRDLLPVLRLEEREIPSSGEVWRRLQERFSEYVARYVAAQAGA